MLELWLYLSYTDSISTGIRGFAKGMAFWSLSSKRRVLFMATADQNGKNTRINRGVNEPHTFNLALSILYAFMGVVGAIFGILEFPNPFKMGILILVALFWVFFEFSRDRVHQAQTSGTHRHPRCDGG
jgi:hypothetical protein